MIRSDRTRRRRSALTAEPKTMNVVGGDGYKKPQSEETGSVFTFTKQDRD